MLFLTPNPTPWLKLANTDYDGTTTRIYRSRCKEEHEDIDLGPSDGPLHPS